MQRSQHLFIDLPPHQAEQHSFLTDVVQGLQKPQKELPCKYFYDEVGSQIFDQICTLDEYYQTRTEMLIMEQQIDDIVSHLGPDCLLIEYGSGSSLKTRLLLDHLPSIAAYVPIDISREHLEHSAQTLRQNYPDIEILPICADYTCAFTLPQPTRYAQKKVAYYPGSTIGNFMPAEAQRFLQRIAQTCAGGGLLIGVDLKKDGAILHRAYNDQQRITARFNLHLLERINAELGADFQVDQFGHYAFYHPIKGRIEMHLISRKKQKVHIDGMEFLFAEGESIWTENSYKYTLDEFASLAERSGFKVEHVWLDPDAQFSVLYLSTYYTAMLV